MLDIRSKKRSSSYLSVKFWESDRLSDSADAPCPVESIGGAIAVPEIAHAGVGEAGAVGVRALPLGLRPRPVAVAEVVERRVIAPALA